MSDRDTLAAVDLGSNSFHLLIGRVVDGQVYALDSLRDTVRLGAGLTSERRLDRATQARALETLRRFRERLRDLPRSAVRAVGTNALRAAKNAGPFLREAREALGFPIEVIAGREEARLIYLGVAHALPPAAHRRLVMDIGGGSTEFIIGEGFAPQLTESLYMGCVSYSLRYFADGGIDKARMRAAETAARQELGTMVKAYRALGWHEAIGSSGTARAIEAIVRENGFGEGGIDRNGLARLRALLLKCGSADPERIVGLRGNRVPVLPGGLAIMTAAFEELEIDTMQVSDSALRHGVLYDLLGRVRHEDMRGATVAQFTRRYQLDTAQAERVSALALSIYDALLADRADRLPPEEDADRQMLDWSARLAEIGLSIAHAQYHKHSAYVLSNADMPGFSRMEQQRLARIVLAHRGKLAKLDDAALEGSDWVLVYALRLASTILRRRTDLKLPLLRTHADASGFVLELPRSWLEANPLTADALEGEAAQWKSVGMKLAIAALTERRVAALGKR